MTIGTQTAITSLATKVSEPMDPIFRQIRDMVYKVCGIFLPEEKLYLMVDACGRRMKELGLRNVVDVKGGMSEWKAQGLPTTTA